MMYVDILAVGAVTVILSQFLLHNIIKMLGNTDNGICSSVNYRGKTIPAIGGIAFVPILLVTILILLLRRSEGFLSYLNYLALVLSMGFAGVVDDLIGDIKIKGLIKHIKSTLRGKMTTGFLKALTGLLMSCIVSLGMTDSYIEFFVNVLIISYFEPF
jgi:UDP-GlcNAc:undecaprenyl-phosphate/decaprenyl-phosphate GlcNAc-1-phosphate transferase